MRGRNPKQVSLVTLASPEDVVPKDHPLRRIKKVADETLAELSSVFDEMTRATVGLRSRPSACSRRCC